MKLIKFLGYSILGTIIASLLLSLIIGYALGFVLVVEFIANQLNIFIKDLDFCYAISTTFRLSTQVGLGMAIACMSKSHEVD